MQVLQTLDSQATRAMFPNIKGPIESCEVFDNGATIVRMARDAWAVIVGGEWRGCCPTRGYALKFALSVTEVAA